MKEALARYLQQSSPQRYELLRETDTLDLHLSQVLARSTPGNHQLELAVGVDPGLLRQAMAVKSCSEDETTWEVDLEKHIAQVGPEAYAEGQRFDRVRDHVQFVVSAARRRLRADLAAGVPRAEALRSARMMMGQRATPIPAPPGEWVAAARGLPALTFQRLEDLIERRDTAPGTTDALERDVMRMLMERPDSGLLLKTSAFENRFGHHVVYHAFLGAWYFGHGDVQAAKGVFRRNVDRWGRPLDYLCLTNCFRTLGELDQADVVLSAALKRYPHDGGLVDIAAGNAFALGDSRRANEIFEPFRPAYFANFPRKEYLETRRLELENAIRTNQLYREEARDLYDDAYAYSTWWNYWNHFNSFSVHQHPEGVLDKDVADYLGRAIRSKLKKPPGTFVEIGTMCGEIIDRLAISFPDTEFYGVDRQANVKALNDAAYTRRNVHFVADDIFRFFEKGPAQTDGMLFHVRTSPFLFPAFLEKLYRTAGEAGCRYVALYELYSLSYDKQKFRTFDEMEEIAEIRRAGLIHHNYPEVLRRAGFRVLHMEIPTPTLLFAGMDSAVFLVAERIS